VALRARWVTLRARWVTLRARWVTLRARRVTLRARWVTLRARWVTLRALWVTLRARWVTLRARWERRIQRLQQNMQAARAGKLMRFSGLMLTVVRNTAPVGSPWFTTEGVNPGFEIVATSHTGAEQQRFGDFNFLEVKLNPLEVGRPQPPRGVSRFV
jgi:hypothetical protein